MGTTDYDPQQQLVRDAIQWVAHCDYLVDFPKSLALSERVIFPVSASERNGIEDARFVRFHDNDARYRYYATYTAFDGTSILPQTHRDRGFPQLFAAPMHGAAARNKGYGAVPSPHWRPLCHVGPPGGREYHPHVL